MKYFKVMLAFCASLAVMFFANYLICRFSALDDNWYKLLAKPAYAPHLTVYEIGFFIAFGFAVMCCTFTIVRPKLRKNIALWLIIAAFSILWSLLLFKWKSPFGALGICLSIIVALTFLLYYYIKNTKELWLAIIPTITWFVYLFAFNYGLCMLN